MGFLLLTLYPAPPSPRLPRRRLGHTPSFTHNLTWSHIIFPHTTLSHTIFHTRNFVTHHLSHTIFHLQFCHTPSSTHTQHCHTPSSTHPHTHFAGQAWHLLTSTFLLRCRCGTYMTLGWIWWRAWSPLGTLPGRRGTWRHSLSFCVAAGVAHLALGWIW